MVLIIENLIFNLNIFFECELHCWNNDCRFCMREIKTLANTSVEYLL